MDRARQPSAGLVNLLEGLSGKEWVQPSLCDGWTVRQVAVHLALQNTTWSKMPQAVADLVRHGGMNGAIRAMACRHAFPALLDEFGTASGSHCWGASFSVAARACGLTMLAA